VSSREELVRIVADHREAPSGVPGALAEMPNVSVSMASLPVADYVLSADLLVERKTAADLSASIVDGRLFSQADALASRDGQAVLVIEGGEIYGVSNLHPNAIRGALSYLVVLADLAVLRSEGPEDTAYLLATMARHAQHGLGYEISLHRKRRSPNRDLQVRYLVEDLPGIGPKTAHELLRAFGSLGALVAANDKALRAVPGVGPKRAAEIREFVEWQYAREAEQGREPPRSECD